MPGAPFEQGPDAVEGRRVWRGTIRSVAAPALIVCLVMAACWYVLRPEGHDSAGPVVYLDGPAARPSLDGNAEARPGHPAPAFALDSLEGEEISLADFRGEWVLVNFWATWCGPCRQEMPGLEHWAASPQNAAAVLAVNLSEDRETVAAFAAEYHLRFPVLLDPRGVAHDAYRIQGAPSSYLVDPSGRIVRVWLGPLTSSDFEDLSQLSGSAE